MKYSLVNVLMGWLVLVGSVGMLTGCPVFGCNEFATPDVVGLTESQARSTLYGAGFSSVDVSYAFSDTVPEGVVMGQSPSAGEPACHGDDEARILVSQGLPIVPNVVGMTEASGVARIQEEQFGVGAVTYAPSDTVSEGVVISQVPAGGTRAPRSTSVAMVVSSGSATVPNVVGMTQEAATAAIVGAGYQLGAVSYTYSDDVAEGEVVSQNPSGGTQAPLGSSVDVVLSAGPETLTGAVPNVVGMNQRDAEQRLTEASFAVGVITEQHDSSPAGTVISQMPEAETEAVLGSAVNLWVSQGPEGVWQKTLGYSGDEVTTAVPWGEGVLLGGYTTDAESFGKAGSVGFVRHIDANGEILNEVVFDGAGEGSETIQKMIAKGGNIVFCGSSDVGGNRLKDMWVGEMNPETGVISWEVTFGLSFYDDVAFDIAEGGDGYWVVGMWGGSQTAGVLAKITPAGEVMWQNQVFTTNKLRAVVDLGNTCLVAGEAPSGGGTASVIKEIRPNYNTDYEEWRLEVVRTRNQYYSGTALALYLPSKTAGEFLVGGQASFTGKNSDFFLAMIDWSNGESGTAIWEQNYGGTQREEGFKMLPLGDSILITGSTNSDTAGATDLIAIKTDAGGTPLWEKRFGGTSFDKGTAVSTFGDGHYLFSGVSSSYSEGSRVFAVKTNQAGESGPAPSATK